MTHLMVARAHQGCVMLSAGQGICLLNQVVLDNLQPFQSFSGQMAYVADLIDLPSAQLLSLSLYRDNRNSSSLNISVCAKERNLFAFHFRLIFCRFYVVNIRVFKRYTLFLCKSLVASMLFVCVRCVLTRMYTENAEHDFISCI